MGQYWRQYWMVVNLTKREVVNPHYLGCGLKLAEQLGTNPGTGAALIVLLAAMPKPRGGGDFDMDENWHGPERKFPQHNVSPGPMPDSYPEIARRTIGRWAGDQIALVGDYGEVGDIQGAKSTHAGKLYFDEGLTDISEDVAAVIGHELHGEFVGDGWRDWKPLK